jgi:segregation and condensation protein B
MQDVEQVPDTGNPEELNQEPHSNDEVGQENGPQPDSEINQTAEPEDGGDQNGDEDVVVAEALTEPARATDSSNAIKAVIEAAIYITDEPLSVEQIAAAVEQPIELVKEILAQLAAEYASPGRGLSIRELAGGYKMSTKPEHHEAIRRFVKNLQPPLKLSLAALETLAVIAYKQPITAPEIMEIRGVQGTGVLKTLLDRKLIAGGGRKNVIGKPILYKTTREFLIQFGLNSLAELPTLKEFEELGRLALSESEEYAGSGEPEQAPPQAEVASEPVESAVNDNVTEHVTEQPIPEETDVKPSDA